ncbi:ubiquitin-like family [Trichomonas vaginalis G3]|uniref:ubiquitin-like family n=1 Tax=Trichomonas vaginalis (strain ATCC PRA-98 / G3) TaxID=412133 RepID=UPI0021E5FE5A|nr:ubiquitin-like family [Trichomonas vaginalis G3]KAI5540305.1 ubiquitin-like family [Trichomonas vaginalis G3]
MDAYIIRFNQNLDFYVPFDEPLTAGEVKQEMFLQLEESTSSMFLIYNGEILKDESKLETLGIKKVPSSTCTFQSMTTFSSNLQSA